MNFYQLCLKTIEADEEVFSGDCVSELMKIRALIRTNQPEPALENALQLTKDIGLSAPTAALLGAAAIVNNRQDVMAQCYDYVNRLPDQERTSIYFQWAEDCNLNGFYGRAAALLQPLTEHYVDNDKLSFKLAKTRLSSGVTAGVWELLRPMLRADPNNEDILIECARYHFLTGQSDDAQQLALKALNMNGSSVGALKILAQTRAKGVQSEKTANFARALADRTLEPHDAAQIAYSLGSLYEQEEEYDDAFDFYTRANAHQIAAISFPIASIISSKRERIEKIKRLCASLPKEADRGNGCAPLFIIGMPRSGTTLAEQILSMHPNVAAGGERSEIPYWVDEALRSESISGPDQTIKWLAQQRSKWRKEFLAIGGLGTSIVIDKTPGNIEHLHFIQWLFPEAKFILMGREVHDTVFSVFASPIRDSVQWAAGIENIIEYYKFSLDCLTDAPPVDVLPMHYEALVKDLRAQVEKMLQHCELPWHAQCLSFVDNRRPVNTLSAVQVRQPLYTTSVNRWRRFKRMLSPWNRALDELDAHQKAVLSSLAA